MTIMNFYTFIFYSFFCILSSKTSRFTEFTLDNGLHVILHEDNSTPIVAISVMYHVGSKMKTPKEQEWLIFEHLLFEGSENISGVNLMIILKIQAEQIMHTHLMIKLITMKYFLQINRTWIMA